MSGQKENSSNSTHIQNDLFQHLSSHCKLGPVQDDHYNLGKRIEILQHPQANIKITEVNRNRTEILTRQEKQIIVTLSAAVKQVTQAQATRLKLLKSSKALVFIQAI